MARVSLSPRLRAIADELGKVRGLRVLEIGSGTGALARELVRRGADVVAIDRSARAHAIAAELAGDGGPRHRHVAIEDLVLADGETPFDLVVAVRVGVLDGRHPGEEALARVASVLRPGGRLLVERAGTLHDATRSASAAAGQS